MPIVFFQNKYFFNIFLKEPQVKALNSILANITLQTHHVFLGKWCLHNSNMWFIKVNINHDQFKESKNGTLQIWKWKFKATLTLIFQIAFQFDSKTEVNRKVISCHVTNYSKSEVWQGFLKLKETWK